MQIGSIAGLLVAMLDLNRSVEVYERYDALDALSLFRQLQISERMIDEFLRPIPWWACSSRRSCRRRAMELLYYYALAHQVPLMCAGSSRASASNCLRH